MVCWNEIKTDPNLRLKYELIKKDCKSLNSGLLEAMSTHPRDISEWNGRKLEDTHKGAAVYLCFFEDLQDKCDELGVEFPADGEQGRAYSEGLIKRTESELARRSRGYE